MKKKIVGILIPVIIVVGVLGIFAWPNPVFQNPSFACALTEGNPQGPYYIAGAPNKEKLGDGLEGQPLIISGQVLNQNCDPVPEAIIDVWQTDSNIYEIRRRKISNFSYSSLFCILLLRLIKESKTG